MTKPHFITADASDYENDIDAHALAFVAPAKASDVEKLLAQKPDTLDGRSGWVWLRLRDGTLFLGFFPTGDAYMEMSDAGVCDFGGETE